jgi:hypothetical protein
MNAKQISEINYRFSVAHGKFYCMSGLCVALEDYRDATLYLRCDFAARPLTKRDALSFVFQLSRVWRNMVELRGASYFNAKCRFKSGGSQHKHKFNLSIPGDVVEKKMLDEVLSLRIPPSESELVTITISGHIDADIPVDLSPNRHKSGYQLNYDKKAELN